MQAVARIEEDDIVARGHIERLVHCVVQSFVGLAEAVDFARLRCQAVTFLVVVNGFEGIVLGVTIYDDVLYVWIVLCLNAGDGSFDERGGVIGDGGNGDFERRVHFEGWSLVIATKVATFWRTDKELGTCLAGRGIGCLVGRRAILGNLEILEFPEAPENPEPSFRQKVGAASARTQPLIFQ